MAQDMKYSSSGRMKIYAGYKPGNMAAFMYGSTKQSRRNRRRQKDEMMRLELVVQFFDDPTPKSTVNKMRQLLGKQRKQEEFLDGERHYNPRVRE